MTFCNLILIIFSNRSRLIDGTHVIQENDSDNQSPTHNLNSTVTTSAVATTASNLSSRGGSFDENIRTGPPLPPVGHNDVITDLVLCKTQKQTFIASSSRDGVIKLWK